MRVSIPLICALSAGASCLKRVPARLSSACSDGHTPQVLSRAAAWNQGQLAHLIPTASHDRFLIKASFKAPLTRAPRLSYDVPFKFGGKLGKVVIDLK